MAKISLRAYNREIEKLIDHGQTEEATAHCKYILKLFPKHIDTYRLLGKAYLESQRYSEAADILQRVLAVTPDDFVSQIGLSIIREDEGNLDAAIWNMERAFEVQPSNAAVQDELRRLYGNRDGVEPPRVRLTRGALVRMYTRGELYQQAIAEARAAISEDPKRTDLEILLARNYYLSKNYIEATEICGRLVKKLPYCYEANWILSEILPTINKPDEARVFTKRVQELDPYAAFIDRSTPTSAQVPEDTVTLEKLEWMPSMESAEQPQWAKSIGIQIDSDAEKDAESWLQSMPAQEQGDGAHMPFIVPEVSQPKSDDVIPEWMREDGWNADGGSKDGESEQQTSAFLFDEPEHASEEGHVPEWLQAMKPEDTDLGQPAITPTAPANSASQDLTGLPDWMQEIESGGFENQKESQSSPFTTSQPDTGMSWQAIDRNETPDGTNAFLASPTEMNENEQASQGMDDLSALPKEVPVEDVPAWLKDLEQTSRPAEPETTDTTSAFDTPTFTTQETPMEPADQLADIPDWLKEIETTSARPPESFDQTSPLLVEADEELAGEPQSPELASQESQAKDSVPDWLKEFDSSNKPVSTTLPLEQAGVVEDVDASLPDWLRNMEDSSSAPVAKESIDTAELTSIPESELSDWLSETTAEQELTPAHQEIEQNHEPQETVLSAQPSQDIADWLNELDAEEDSSLTPSLAETSIPSTPEELEVETPAAKSDDIDEAFAWLESLAAKHGADEDALSTPEEERTTDVPDWLQDLDDVQPDQENISAQLSETEQEPDVPMPDWIEELDSEPEEEQVLHPAAQAEDIPDWLNELGEEKPSLEEELGAIDPSLDIQPAVTESTEQISQPLDPGDLSSTAGLPDWLQEMDSVSEPDTDTPLAAQAEDMPDWLSELGQDEKLENFEQTENAPAAGQNPQETAPIMESDSQPLGAVFPDWLEELENSTDSEPDIPPAAQAENLPDWLMEIGQDQPASGDSSTAADITAEETMPIQESPELISRPLESKESAFNESQPVWPEESEELEEITPVEEMPSITSSEVTAAPEENEEEDAFAWLESLAARHGADEEALVTSSEERSDVPPEWVQELGKEEVPEKPAEQIVASDSTPETLSISTLDTGVDLLGSPQIEIEPESETEDDKEAQAREWLQSLASGKPTVPAVPVSDETAEETPTEPVAAEREAEAFEIIETPIAEETAQDISEAIGPDTSVNDKDPALMEQELAPELPDWLRETSEAENISKLEPSDDHTVTSWLRELDGTKVESADESPVQIEQPETISDVQQAAPVEDYQEDLTSSVEPQADIEEEQEPSRPAVEEAPAPVVAEPVGKQLDALQMLKDGHIEEAVEIYKDLIKDEENLDAVIKDLNTALYDHPVDTILWLTLGDAYTQKREMQNALSAYTKAEELLR